MYSTVLDHNVQYLRAGALTTSTGYTYLLVPHVCAVILFYLTHLLRPIVKRHLVLLAVHSTL